MGDAIHITRVVDRFSSHTLSQSRRSRRSARATAALREKLIAAMVEVIAGGRGPLPGTSDPRLDQSRALP